MSDEPLSPACMMCERVTGNSTCFPDRCVFYREKDIPGTDAFNIARLDRIRRGARSSVHASSSAPPTEDMRHG